MVLSMQRTCAFGPASFRKKKVQFSEKKVNFNFFEVGLSHWHTASYRHASTVRSSLQWVEADRAHLPPSKPLTVAGIFVQVATAFFLKFNFLRRTELCLFRRWTCPSAHATTSPRFHVAAPAHHHKATASSLLLH